jgi:carboxyl-terminal processing protease
MIPPRFRSSRLVAALVAALFLGVALGTWMPQDDDFFEMRKNFRIFGAVYEELVTGYVRPVDPERLMRAGVEAMLAELDPYTTFLDEADNASIDLITQGRYGGVGLDLGERAGRITVVAPVEGAGGYEQGVRAGDVITSVNGQPASTLSLDDAETLLRGEPGTTVDVTVERAGAPAPIDFTLTREEIDPEDVSYRGRIGADETIGYLKLERFTRDAASDVETALREMMEAGALEGVVLDLRDNPGGLLHAAVGVTELFVPEGATVVSTEGRLPAANNTYRSDRAPLLPDRPLVVLVNRYSASASEIVAGAVQDHDRGVVLGTTTYGKGLVQAIRSLPHNTSLKMTTAQYRTPSGRKIQRLAPTPTPDTSTATAVPTDDASSARHAHETAHGRTVRDGDGLRPDVRVAADSAGALEEALSRQAAFFFYANHFAATRDTVGPSFAATDETLADFRAWLEAEDIRYPTDAEHAIRTLRRRLDGGPYEDVKKEVATLREAVRAEKQAAFRSDAPALKRHLEREILARFVTEEQRTAALLPHDRQVGAAADLLRDSARYAAILTPEE